jgi:hypothetical protein
VEQEVRDHQRADRAENQAGVEVHRDERRLDDDAARERPQDHQQDEEVHHVDEEVERLIQDVRQEAQRDARDHAAHDDVGGRDRDDEEAHEDDHVVLARTVLRTFFVGLLLTEEVDADVDQARR